MDFVSWLDDHIVSDKRLEGIFGNEVLLEDVNDDVRIRVKQLGQAVVGIPDKMGQWRILKEREWYKTCDFILFGEHPRHGQYVFLVELKRTPRDLEELRSDQDDGGRMELRWNISRELVVLGLTPYCSNAILNPDQLSGCVLLILFCCGIERGGYYAGRP